MPVTSSAQKALKVALRRKNENDIVRAKVKSAVKGLRNATGANKEEANELLTKAYKELDLAAKKHVIHKNKASRLKSRLAKKIATVETVPAKPVKKAAKKK